MPVTPKRLGRRGGGQGRKQHRNTERGGGQKGQLGQTLSGPNRSIPPQWAMRFESEITSDAKKFLSLAM